MRHVYIIFGEMGTGKSYIGNLFARQIQGTFLEGDTLLPEVMARRVERFQSLPAEMIDSYVSTVLTPAIVNNSSQQLVVAQALYRRRHREHLRAALESAGIAVSFVWIQVPFWRNISQLWSRPRGFRWVFYWLLSKPWFEPPLLG